MTERAGTSEIPELFSSSSSGRLLQFCRFILFVGMSGVLWWQGGSRKRCVSFSEGCKRWTVPGPSLHLLKLGMGRKYLWLVKEWVRKVREPTLGLRGTEVLVICFTSRMKAGERRPEGEEMVDSIYTRCYEKACSLHKLYWACITPILSRRKQKWSQGWFSQPVSPFLFLYIPW